MVRFGLLLSVVLSLLLSLDISPSKGDATYDCATPKGEYGNCIPLTGCESLENILKYNSTDRESIRYLQNSTCGFTDDNKPLVCCPKANEVGTKVDTPTTQTDSPLITTEKPPELPGGKPNQVESSSQSPQEGPKKIISQLLPNTSECGMSASVTDIKIVGGKNAGLGQYPWVSLLGYEDGSGNTQWACGGSLISKRYVLTAAHCVKELPTSIHLATVKVGEYNQSSDPDCINNVCAPKVQIIKIEEVIAHEHYDETSKKENDIALIRLQDDATLGPFVMPVCLSGLTEGDKPRNTNRDYDFVVAGFGRLAYDSPEGSSVLQYVKVPIVSKKKCNEYYADKAQVGAIDNSRFCAGGEDGKDSCKGDSGGPLMTALMLENHVTQTFFQYGIVSLGPSRCGVMGQPALYTSVSYFKQWIIDHIRP